MKNFCRRLTETKALTDRDVTTGTKYMGSINNVIRDRAAKVVFGINGSLDSSGYEAKTCQKQNAKYLLIIGFAIVLGALPYSKDM